MSEKVRGIVQAVSEKTNGIKIDGRWYHATGKAKEYLPQKGETVELLVEDDGDKVSFCRKIEEETNKPKEAQLPTVEDIAEQSVKISEILLKGLEESPEFSLRAREAVFRELMADRRTNCKSMR